MVLDAFNLKFDEKLVSLKAEGLSNRLAEYSDSARVPVLQDDELSVWDSLAICEYLNDNYLSGNAWPQDKKNKALARSLCAEMHAGMTAMRNEMPMNIRASRKVELSAAAHADVQRVDAIWSKYARPDNSGDLRLFGRFSIADCFFAPVVMRFNCYKPDVSSAAQAYADSMLAHPSLKKWIQSALSETEIIVFIENKGAAFYAHVCLAVHAFFFYHVHRITQNFIWI